MDDGTRHGTAGVQLCTDSFTYTEVLLLKSVLETKFNLIVTIHNKKSRVAGSNRIYYRLYISKSSLADLNKLVREHFHPSMLYKI
jgi:hypothetical protein